MAINIKRGYAFNSALSLRDMKQKLDAVSPKPWEEGDSAYRDYLGGRLNKDGVARIYEVGGAFVVNFLFFSRDPGYEAALEDAERALFDRVLPAIGASEPRPCDPVE